MLRAAPQWAPSPLLLLIVQLSIVSSPFSMYTLPPQPFCVFRVISHWVSVIVPLSMYTPAPPAVAALSETRQSIICTAPIALSELCT